MRKTGKTTFSPYVCNTSFNFPVGHFPVKYAFLHNYYLFVQYYWQNLHNLYPIVLSLPPIFFIYILLT